MKSSSFNFRRRRRRSRHRRLRPTSSTSSSRSYRATTRFPVKRRHCLRGRSVPPQPPSSSLGVATAVCRRHCRGKLRQQLLLTTIAVAVAICVGETVTSAAAFVECCVPPSRTVPSAIAVDIETGAGQRRLLCLLRHRNSSFGAAGSGEHTCRPSLMSSIIRLHPSSPRSPKRCEIEAEKKLWFYGNGLVVVSHSYFAWRKLLLSCRHFILFFSFSFSFSFIS